MEGGWMLAGAALALGLLLAAPVRVGFRVRAQSARVDVRALYELGGPIRGSVRIPSFSFFRRPGRAPGRGPAGGGGLEMTLAVSALRAALAVFRRVDRFEWTTRVGTGDAAWTSWCAGFLWALMAGTVASFSRRVVWLSPPRLSVTPDFGEACFHLDLTCIFRFRIGEVIVAAVSYALGRLRKGGM